MDISIIIVNYKVKEYIVSCIHSIYKHSSPKYKFEIIVIDNRSQDGSVEAIKSQYPNVTIIENNSNIGFSKAANQGAKEAKGQFILILNPDTVFQEDSLSKLISFSNKHENLAVVGPQLRSELDMVQQSFWRKPTLINTILGILHLDSLNYKKNYRDIQIDGVINVDTISGAVFFTKKYIFETLKGFNEDLFWMEDIDYCIRAKKLNFKIYYYPKTKIVHYQGKSSNQNWTIAISNQLLSKIKFFRIHKSKISTYLLSTTILFSAIIKFAILLILSPFDKSYKTKMVGYFNVVRTIIFDS